MTKLTRDQLINEYAQKTIDSMDLDDCLVVLHDCLTKTYETYSTEEIIEEVTEYYPEIMSLLNDEPCRYCGGNCPNDEDHACDSYLGDIDNLYTEIL